MHHLLMVAHLPHPLHSVLNVGVYLLSLAYTVWAIHQFYGGSGVRSWLRAGTTYLVSFFLLIVLSVVIGVIAGIGSEVLDKL